MEETHSEIHYLDRNSADFPAKLKDYANMPVELYYKGRLPDPDKPVVAIVGARMCSPYGRLQAFRYARVLSAAGVQIISGLAYGIDAEAHKGAIEGGTETFAVLGCGVDLCYPTANKNLYQKILDKGGGILSEYPPGTKARSYHFPIRNRIISALSDLVLVIEAKDKSGSLITARYAMEQGVDVFALPGIVTDELSIGCHKLIFDGAGIAYSPEILLSQLGFSDKISTKTGKMPSEKKNLGIASDLKLVYSVLDLRPKTPEMLLTETGFTEQRLNQALVELELLGLAKEVLRHHYIKSGES